MNTKHHSRRRDRRSARDRWWIRIAVGGSAVTLSLWLAGCATSPDPAEGGFVSGVVGLAGGGYQRRIDERQGAYQSELDDQARLMAEAQAVKQERAAVRGELRKAESRLSSQRRRIAAARSKLLAQSQRTASVSSSLKQLDLAEARIGRTDSALQAVDPDSQPVPDLRARSAEIERQLDEIDAMVEVVGGAGF